MRNKSSVPRATKTVASPSGQGSSRTPASARTNGSGKSRPNSTVRQSSLEPYHDIAASVFSINDTAELETMFLAAARVSIVFCYENGSVVCQSTNSFSYRNASISSNR